MGRWLGSTTTRGTKEKKRFKKHALRFELLEQRILLSADAFGGIVDADDIALPTAAFSAFDKIRDELQNKLQQYSPLDVQSSLGSMTSTVLPDIGLHTPDKPTIDLTSINRLFGPSLSTQEISDDTIHNLVIVDGAVSDYEQLLFGNELTGSTAIAVIDTVEDGIVQLTNAIAQFNELESIHILSHGSSGSLQLGNSQLNLAALQDSDTRDLVMSWKNYTAHDADLLIYGCNVAAGSEGLSMIGALRNLTNMDVAASVDLTGAASLSGNWNLEFQSGHIESTLVVSSEQQESWQNTLATITVNTNEDQNLSFGINSVAQLLERESEISLREAIQAINKEYSFGGSTPTHTIVFDLEEDQIITLTSQLPSLARSLIIDGTTQVDDGEFAGVVIDGFGTVFNLTGDNIELRGLEITGGSNGVVISGNDNTVAGNYIHGNSQSGIVISGADNVIGGSLPGDKNIISGNAENGIEIYGTYSDRNLIAGNWIGLALDGHTNYGNFASGIVIESGSNGTQIGGANSGNVISGNRVHGIHIEATDSYGISNHSILGNIIGLNSSGTDSVANEEHGVFVVNAQNISIGDGTSEGRNIISGNLRHGIEIHGEDANDIYIYGNYVGTDISGTVALGNGYNGVEIYEGPSSSWTFPGVPSSEARIAVGGKDAGQGNLISGNSGDGVTVDKNGVGVNIFGNIIGLDITEKNALGNGQNGITVKAGESSSYINAETSIEDNHIAYNTENGVVVRDGSQGVSIIKNRIHDNALLGIDLSDDGFTENDPADFDGGGNRQFNFPEISVVDIQDGLLRLAGALEYSNSNTSSNISIHVYYSDHENSNGAANAEYYLGTFSFTPNYSGYFEFDELLDASIPSSSFITVTSTSAGGTSEFSPGVLLEEGNIPNLAPTGSVTITGNLVQGALLTAVNSISDGNGITSPLQYQWRRNGELIASANDVTYELTQADVGKNITVEITYVDDDGYNEIVTSEPTVEIDNVNDPAVGSITITGNRVEDQTLRVDYSIKDSDGLPESMDVQWFRDGVAIVGETSESYTLNDADVGSKISVEVSFTDDLGGGERLTSSQTVAIENINDNPDGSLTFSGEAVEDNILSSVVDITDADGITGEFTYQWYRDGVSITGATGDQYRLVDADVGAVVNYSVSYQDNQGAAEILFSDPSQVIANANDSPIGTLDIVGSNVEGESLFAQVNFTDADGISGPIGYQWYRDGVIISGAIDSNYTITNDDVGHQLSVVANYQDNYGENETIASDATNLVNNTNQQPTGDISIVGLAQENETLSVEIDLDDPDGLPEDFNFRWYRDGIAIVGADQIQYTLSDQDVGAMISVEVSYLDNLGSTESVFSSQTTAVTNINDIPEGSLSIVGSNREGETLAIQNNISDEDGLPETFAFQWYRGDEVIIGATESTYTLGEVDVGEIIRVTLIYVDAQGTEETFTSSPFGPISNVNQLPTGSLDILGAAIEDGILTAQNNFVDNDGMPTVIQYQWYRGNQLIEGATDVNYQLSQEDVGFEIYVNARYVDGRGSDEHISSQATAAVENANDAPQGELVLSGNASEGQIVSVNNQVTDDDGIAVDLGYQWFRNGVVIAGENSEQYQLTAEDIGANIYVVWQYEDAHNSIETIQSSTVENIQNVNSVPTGSVLISGSLTENSVLTASNTLEDVDGISGAVQYQWYQDGVLLVDATGETLQLSDNSAGYTYHVIATYTDEYGTVESVASQGFGPIQPANNLPQGYVLVSGEIMEDQTLNISHDFVDLDGLPDDFSYQWYRNGIEILGATGERYTLSAEDVGFQISVQVSYTDQLGFTEVVSSDPTAVVEQINHPAYGDITISGTLNVGGILHVTHNLNDRDGLGSHYEIQWLRDGEIIIGAMGDSYTIIEDDSGHTLSVLVSFTDARGYEEVLTSGSVMVAESLVSQNIASRPNTGDEFGELPLPLTPNFEDDVTEGSNVVVAEEEVYSQADIIQVDKTPSNQSSTIDSDRFMSLSTLADNHAFIPFISNNQVQEYDNTAPVKASNAVELVVSATSENVDLNVPSLNRLLSILENQAYNDQLERDINNADESQLVLSRTLVGGSAAISTGLSVGYLAWTLRSGVLMTSLLSSLPVWRFIDPLPVLETQHRRNDEDDESLESMVDTSDSDEISGYDHV